MKPPLPVKIWKGVIENKASPKILNGEVAISFSRFLCFLYKDFYISIFSYYENTYIFNSCFCRFPKNINRFISILLIVTI